MKEKLEFGYPRTMDDAVQKSCICYQKMNQKNEGPKGATRRKIRNLPPKRKLKVINGINNQQKTFGKFARNPPKAPTYTLNRQLKGISKLVTNQLPKPPLQCWGCRESHYYNNCPHKDQIE